MSSALPVHLPRRAAVTRCLLAIVLVLALARTDQGATSAPLPGPHAIGQVYLALGDSLGVGLLSSLPETRGYVVLLQALLQRQAQATLQVRNLSVSGESTTSFLRPGGQLDAAVTAIQDAQQQRLRVSPITIDLGGNDLRALLNSNEAAREQGLATFRANLRASFDRLLAATTVNGARTSDLAIASLYNPYGGDPSIAGSDAWWVERFNSALTEEAAARDIAVAHVYERFRGHERELTWMPLDFHANNAGHVAIAEELWRATGYDTTPPALELDAPTPGQSSRPIVTVKFRASDAIGVTRVAATLDGTALPEPFFEAGFGLYVTYWDARAASPGEHRLRVTVSDAAGNATEREVTLRR